MAMAMVEQDIALLAAAVVGPVCVLTAVGVYKYLKRRSVLRRNRVIIFSRYPEAGKSKTRLIPLLGPDGAAEAQLHMTNQLIRRMQNLQQKSSITVELRHSSGSKAEMQHWLKPFDPSQEHSQLFWREQFNGDLGQRLAHAFRTAFQEGAKYVVLVGSDIPAIDEEIVSEAFSMLMPSEDRQNVPLVVLGPAADGGYYLVAASKSVLPHLDDLFQGMTWGTEKVLQQQLSVARRLDLQPSLLSRELNDVDVPSEFVEFERVFGIQASQLTLPSWSIVIPVLNEATNIKQCLHHTVQTSAHPDRLQLVVCDGGSTDNTLEILRELREDSSWLNGATLTLCQSSPGRATQQNNAVQLCTNDNLIFLHADTRLPQDFEEDALRCLRKPGNIAGAFPFSLDVLHPGGPKAGWFFLLEMRFLCRGVQRRVRLYELPYGDQALFIRRQTFLNMGGFADMPLMEDYELVHRIHKLGHVQLTDGPPAITSARRWLKHGWLKITGLNQIIIAAYELGVSPHTLARWYYGKPKLEQD